MALLSVGRLRAALRKEFRQFLRDPVILYLVLWLYTIEIVICAVALTFDLKEEPVAVLDFDRSNSSIALADRFDRTSAFDVAYHVRDEREAGELLDKGDASMALIMPPGYGEELSRGGAPTVQLLVDGTNSLIATAALGVARRLVAESLVLRWQELAPSGAALSAPRVPALGGAPALPRLENRIRIWYNPDLRFVYFIVISMIALAAYIVGVIHPAATIVKEKESGTIEQIMVSPLSSGELIVAKTLPTLVIGMLDLGPALLIARAFGVPFRGDLSTFAVVSAVFLVSAIATGILVATWTRTLQQALLVSFFILFPVLFLSGTITPIESMPPLLQSLSLLSPLRHYMEALLAIFLKGVGLETVWPQLLWMTGLGAGLLAVSIRFFQRRLAAA
jgi:ABC-2 type transport system permease protein